MFGAGALMPRGVFARSQIRDKEAVAKLSGLGWGLRYWWLVGWLGWRFRSAGWRPAGGVDFKQVGDGVLEGPFAAGTGLAAHREAAEPAVVLDVPEGSFGDWAAVAVGGDAWGGGQPGRHRGDRAVAGGPGRAAVAGGVFEVMAFAGGDQPVRAGAGQVGLAAVPGVGQRRPGLGSQPVQRPPRVAAQQCRGGFGLAGHRLEA